jgi:hypothetical protein
MEKRRYEMRHLIGKKCKLTIKDQVNNKILFYTAKEILEITDTHIFFIDKFDQEVGFRLIDIIQTQLCD